MNYQCRIYYANLSTGVLVDRESYEFLKAYGVAVDVTEHSHKFKLPKVIRVSDLSHT